MNEIWKWVGFAGIVIFLATIFVGNLFLVCYLIKCGRVKKCYNTHCKYKTFCHKYEDKITKEDIDRLQELIGQL